MSTPDDDRDELVVELLTRIIARLDGIEEAVDGTKDVEPENETIDRKMARASLVFAKVIDDRTKAIQDELTEDRVGAIFQHRTRDAIQPLLHHVDQEAIRFETERHRMEGEIARLEYANRTWLWAAPSLALAAIILFVLGSRFAIHTVFGCTILGGRYDPGKAGYVDVCFFNAGGWW